MCCGEFSKLEIGDILDCRESVNGSMANQMVLVVSARQIGIISSQTES